MISMLGFTSLSHAQGVLDKLKQKVDQLNRSTQGSQPKQAPRVQQPPAQPNSNPQRSNSQGTLPAETPAGDVAAIAPNAGFVDLAGLKPGMTVKDTMLALRAVNPDLNLAPQTFRLPGFGDQDLLDTVQASSMLGRESVTLAFTVPPGPEVLWGARRMMKYADNERPAAGKVLAELQKKYGPENGTFGRTRYWVFDARGTRQNVTPNYFPFGNCLAPPLGVQSEITNGYSQRRYGLQRDSDCDGFTIVTADIDTITAGKNGDSIPLPEQPVQILTITVENVPLHHATVEAARAVALRAQQKQDARDTQELKNRPIPKM
jgi:hypothetical protein